MARSERRLLLAGLGALAGATLVACNALIGLSDFDKVECSGPNGLECPDGPREGGVVVKDGGPDVIDATPDAPVTPGTPPVAWARWPMPSWEGGREPVPDFKTTASATELLEDRTGLVWSTEDLATTSYDDAKARCAALPNGPWRLPKRIELVTLIDPTRVGTNDVLTFKQSFPKARQAAYWTSSEVRPLQSPMQYWVVDFTPATKNASTKLVRAVPIDSTESVYVRCVRDKS